MTCPHAPARAHARFSPRMFMLMVLPALLPLPGASTCQSGDVDEDGWTTAEGDCDDSDPATYPNAPESCDGKDDDCDGAVDEDLATPWYPDGDGDSYGSAAGQVVACGQPTGHVARAGDCNDDDPAVSPGALEVCSSDGSTAGSSAAIDENCDGVADNGVLAQYFPDQDGDGFGDSARPSCQTGAGFVAARGDCNDADPAIHPGAGDASGDGIDQDCGGTQGADPHVGLSTSSLNSIQIALDRASSGATIWVGPGNFREHDLTFRGRSLRLISTNLAAGTVIDARAAGRVMVFTGGEGPDSVVDGFTLTGGYVNTANGGALIIAGSSPTIRYCIISGSSAHSATTQSENPGGDGGGVSLHSSSASITHCTISGNQAVGAVYNSCAPDGSGCLSYFQGGRGGGLFLDASTPTLTDTLFSGNSAQSGGGAHFSASSPPVARVSFVKNVAVEGGGLYLDHSSATIDASGFLANSGVGGGAFVVDSSPTIRGSLFNLNTTTLSGGGLAVAHSQALVDNCVFSGNAAFRGQSSGGGGGLYLEASTGIYRNSRFEGNQAERGGGGFVWYGSATFSNDLVMGNYAIDAGGGLEVTVASPTISSCTVVGNVAGYAGGGLYLAGNYPSPIVTDSILAYNEGYNVYDEPEGMGSPAIVSYSDLYSADGSSNYQLSAPGEGFSTVEPGFLRYGGDGRPASAHLALGSPLIGKGSSQGKDVDGSSTDLGAYGGAGGGGWDLDRDGFPDYFWPGTIEDAPAGFSSSSYDCEDGDPSAVCSQNAALTWSVEERIRLKPPRTYTPR